MGEKETKMGVVCVTNSDEILHTIIHETLKQILGENPSRALLYHVGVSNSAVEIKTFIETLEEIYGPGSYFLEKSILENLFSAIGKTFQEKEGSKFIDYVNEIDGLVLSSNRN